MNIIKEEEWRNRIHEKFQENENSTYLETIIELFKEHDVELELIKKIVDDNLKEKLRTEGEQLNLIKKDVNRLI